MACHPCCFGGNTPNGRREKWGGKITYASWRNKWTGWHDSYALLIRGRDGFIKSRLSQGDMFYALFLGNLCFGKQCYKHCKYKYKSSSADIRIGDMWGDTYKDNVDGVSCAIAFTEKGNIVLGQTNCEIIPYPFEIVAWGQMRGNLLYPKVMRTLLLIAVKTNFVPVKLLSLFSRVVNRLKLFY